MKKMLTFLLIGLFAQLGFTQSSILENYLNQALKENLSIQTTQLERTKQLAKIDIAQRQMGPSADFEATYLLAKGGRTLNFPIGDLFNPTNTALNSLMGSDQFPTDLENVKIQLTPHNFVDAQLTVSQPLIFSSIRYNIKIQEELLQLNDLDIALQEQDIAYQVKTAYFNYLKTLEGAHILEESEKLLKAVLNFNQKLVKFDKATEEIVYDVEFQIENLNSQQSIIQEQNAVSKSFFNLLLNKNLDAEILVDENFLKEIQDDASSLENLTQIALNQRLELQKITVANQVNVLNEQRIEKEALPTLGVRGGVGVQTENFNFDQGGPLFSIGLGMNVNLFDNGQRRKRLEEVAVDRNILANNQAQLQQKVEIEVIQVYYALQSLRSRMLSDAAAERNAQKSYDLFKIRYENDKALLIELLQAQNRLTTSQLSIILTKYDFLIKQAELDKVTAK
ncbi:MAG: outer membrane protein [Paraglaciecola sp.]|jgi:outer membrane protein